MSQLPASGLQLRSLITSSGELEVSLAEVPVPSPAPNEVLVRIEASPLNPSDIGLLLGPADLGTVRGSGSPGRPIVTAKVPQGGMKAVAVRLGQSLPVGNEGAGTVVAAGSAAEAQALVGKTVAIIGGAMYAHYRTVAAADCLVLPEGASAADGASAFVNPLTALGMVETMRKEGHKALIHTAAASNLGQMLNRICLADGIKLVNVVRSQAQEKILRGIGAAHVCNMSEPTFADDLIEAIAATDATLAFDAIGGGPLAGQLLAGMEAVASRSATAYSRYGSSVHKQVYIYGGLDTRPTELNRTFGFSWGVGGWLLFPFLTKTDPAVLKRLRARVAAELTTTFASHYTREISLAEALQPEILTAYSRRATGEKYLITPQKSGAE